MTTSDRSKTLEELEQNYWGEPEFDSHLVKTCHRLRRIPLADFTIEDLRIMIGRQIGLEHLIPIVLEELERNPLAEGDNYPGDLLNAALGIAASFWSEHAELRERIRRVTVVVNGLLDSLDEFDAATVREALAKVPDSWLKS